MSPVLCIGNETPAAEHNDYTNSHEKVCRRTDSLDWYSQGNGTSMISRAIHQNTKQKLRNREIEKNRECENK